MTSFSIFFSFLLPPSLLGSTQSWQLMCVWGAKYEKRWKSAIPPNPNVMPHQSTQQQVNFRYCTTCKLHVSRRETGQIFPSLKTKTPRKTPKNPRKTSRSIWMMAQKKPKLFFSFLFFILTLFRSSYESTLPGWRRQHLSTFDMQRNFDSVKSVQLSENALLNQCLLN